MLTVAACRRVSTVCMCASIRGMIARILARAVRAEDATAYAAYVQKTGIEGYQRTPGNRGAWLLLACGG